MGDTFGLFFLIKISELSLSRKWIEHEIKSQINVRDIAIMEETLILVWSIWKLNYIKD